MTKGQFTQAAAKAIGRRIPGHRLSYCIDSGHVDRPVKRAGNCWLYEQQHLDQFIAYLLRQKKTSA